MKGKVRRKSSYLSTAGFLLACAMTLTACSGDSGAPSSAPAAPASSAGSGSASTSSVTESPTPAAPKADVKGSRDNTPEVLVPEATGEKVTANDAASIDYSNASEGYICVSYTGSVSKVKLRITGSDEVTYTYDLHGNGYEVFPLTSGDGSYDVTVYENIEGTSYSTCLHETVTTDITDEFGPFLYPSQYVNFSASSKTVAKGSDLVKGANTDLEAVTMIYDYIVSNITYDYDKASDPPTGYTVDVDEILTSGTGICLDYSAVMCSMLRSQRIPTRLEVGYAQDAYHAWISVYIQDVGWLNDLIQFDGNTWTLVDPTFGANTSNTVLKKFIGDGSNYQLQKIY